MCSMNADALQHVLAGGAGLTADIVLLHGLACCVHTA